MQWLPTSSAEERERALRVATEHLLQEQIVIIPTDTVYGVAALPGSNAAIARLFAAKGRNPLKSLPLLVADLGLAWPLGEAVRPEARRLGERFWPGGLTLVVQAAAVFPSGIAAPDGSIGLRIPAHDLTRSLLRACGGVLAVTSANLSGKPSPRTANEASAIAPAVAALIDAGRVGGQDSTVVDVRGDQPVLLRAGAVPWEVILHTWRQS